MTDGGRRSTWLPGLALSAFVGIVSLIALEGVLRLAGEPRGSGAGRDESRLLHVRSANPRLVYELRPGAELYVEELGQTIATNAAGFRDHEFPAHKAEDVYRIVVLGDSITFGWWQSLDETYPKVLERWLADDGRPGRRVEVFNMAVGGYDTVQEVEVARTKALAYAPDLLILGFCQNDVRVADNGFWLHFSRSRSRVLDSVRVVWMGVERRLGRDLVAPALAELAEIAGREGVPVLVVIFPQFRTRRDGTQPFRAQHERVAALARGHGFAVLDLLETYREAGFENVRQGDDPWHPNALGHRIAAEAILEVLEARGPELGLD